MKQLTLLIGSMLLAATLQAEGMDQANPAAPASAAATRELDAGERARLEADIERSLDTRRSRLEEQLESILGNPGNAIVDLRIATLTALRRENGPLRVLD